jgi:hypothetical protein
MRQGEPWLAASAAAAVSMGTPHQVVLVRSELWVRDTVRDTLFEIGVVTPRRTDE